MFFFSSKLGNKKKGDGAFLGKGGPIFSLFQRGTFTDFAFVCYWEFWVLFVHLIFYSFPPRRVFFGWGKVYFWGKKAF